MTLDEPTAKHHTTAIQKSIETGAREPLRHFDTHTYVQHNPALGDGFGALLEFLDSLPAGTSRVRPLRTFEDGAISFAHLEYFFAPMGALIGFEVHRWHAGRIVEHWDNLEPVSAYPEGDDAESRPWATAGPTEVQHPELTETTRVLADVIARDALVSAREELAREMFAPDVADHGGAPGGGRDALIARLLAEDRIHRTAHQVLVEGEFALLMLSGLRGGQQTAFYYLVRIVDGQVMDLWEVVEEIPGPDGWSNENGKF